MSRGLSALFREIKWGRNKGTTRGVTKAAIVIRSPTPLSPRLCTTTFFSPPRRRHRLLSFGRSNPPRSTCSRDCLPVNFCVKRTLKVDEHLLVLSHERHKQQRLQFQRKQSAEVQTTSVGYHFGNVNSGFGFILFPSYNRVDVFDHSFHSFHCYNRIIVTWDCIEKFEVW